MLGRLLVHVMRGLLVRRRRLLVWVERAKPMPIRRGVVSQWWRAAGALRRRTLVLPMGMLWVSIRGRLRISRVGVASVGRARRGRLVRVSLMRSGGFVRCARRVVGSGLSLPKSGVVLVAWIAMLRVAGPVVLRIPLPGCAIICMRRMRPPVFAHRECPFPSLPVALIHFAFALHPVSVIVADGLQTSPLGIIFHRM